MSNIKVKIKNDLWKINYVIPFTLKYRGNGLASYARKAASTIIKIKVVKNKGKRGVAEDIYQLVSECELYYDHKYLFYYHIDEGRTIAVKGNIIGNFPLDYSKIIKGSFSELAESAIKVGGSYGKDAAIIKDAVYFLYDRICKFLDNNKCSDVYRHFDGLLDRPAEHFSEGLQRILFFNQILWQTRHRLNGIGRVDCMLGELYERDINSGYLTKNKAYNQIKDFLNCLHKNYEYKSAALLGDIGQIIVLGGLDKDGSYFCNDLTELFMKAHAELKYPDPKILLRVSKDMPTRLIVDTVGCLESGTGSPILSNDDVIIHSLIDAGFAQDDSYNYCVSACWEPFIVGKSLDQNNMDCFDIFKVLSDYLAHDYKKYNSSFREFMKGFESKLRKNLSLFVLSLDNQKWAKDPLISMFTDGCNANGIDISEGGAIYSNYGFTTVGMSSVCNSLLNIRKYCFREKKYNLEVLEKYREENFNSNLDILEFLKNQKQYFGHDEEDSVFLVNHIICCMNKVLYGHKNRLGGFVKMGLSSPGYISSGKHTEADLAGRKKGEPYSTHISAEDSNYTELVGFAASLDYSGMNINGNVVDLFMQPNMLKENRSKLELFLKGAIRRGFYQLQMNIMDSKTLIDAKKHPEKHRNLIVRVWGFSAYYNDLPENYKDRLIERALESEGRSV